MTTPPGKPQRRRGVPDGRRRGIPEGRALVLIAISVAVGIVGVSVANWLVVTAMALSVVVQLVGIWLRRRNLGRRYPS